MRVRLAWALLILVTAALSLSIPLFSRQAPSAGALSYPPLHPVYFQSNVDAPLELRTCLGFPDYYREEPYRVSRPTFYAVLAGLRRFALEPAARALSGGAGSVRWGAFTARETVITYFLWLLANLVCVLAAARMAHALVAARLGDAAASLCAFLLLTTPIVLLALREIHLNAYQALTGLACLAFFDALLGDRLTPRGTAAAALGLGLLFLGKPNLNLFGAGALLCLLLGRWRALLAVIPWVALPTLLWMAAVKAMGLEWSVPEVTRWKAGVWILEAGPRLAAAELLTYVRDWSRALGESLTPVHLLLAAYGARVLRQGNLSITEPGLLPDGIRRLPALAALLAAADFAFYFLVHRVHAVYYLGTLLGIYALAAAGLLALAEKAAPRLGPAGRLRLALVALGLLQAFLLARQLPRYPG